MNAYDSIRELHQGERASTTNSWWRYVEGEDFNTFQLVLRKNGLNTINTIVEDCKNFF